MFLLYVWVSIGHSKNGAAKDIGNMTQGRDLMYEFKAWDDSWLHDKSNMKIWCNDISTADLFRFSQGSFFVVIL